jgi:DNA-binding transcriptional regulator YdaS (Cro superfamily)
MHLREYFFPLSAAEREEFALRCETNVKQLLNICGPKPRPCSPELAIHIERETKGQVRVELMAPRTNKMRVDWKYIRGSARRTNRVGA